MVDAIPVSEKDKNSAQIPWRDRLIGPALKLSLMKIVVARGQHLRKGAADVDVQWRLLIGEILRQPEWKFLADQLPTMTAPLEVRLFKDAFNNIINDICKKMGWGPKYGGSSGNLSGQEGEMDELTLLVRQVLFDWEKKKEEKESGKKLQEELGQNEMMVMLGKVQAACKGKRKRERADDGGGARASTSPSSLASGSVSSLSASSPLTELQALDQYLQTGRIPTTNIVAKTPERSEQPDDKEFLFKELEGMPVGEFLEACGVQDLVAEASIRKEGVEVITTLFCECDNRSSKPFRTEMALFNIDASAAMKLFLFFTKLLKGKGSSNI